MPRNNNRLRLAAECAYEMVDHFTSCEEVEITGQQVIDFVESLKEKMRQRGESVGLDFQLDQIATIMALSFHLHDFPIIGVLVDAIAETAIAENR